MRDLGPKRVLFVDCAPGFGGSVVVIRSLLKWLNKERFEPLVLLYHHNEAIPELESLGARVLVLGVPGTGKIFRSSLGQRSRLHRGLGAIPLLKPIVRGVRAVSQLYRYELPMAFRLKWIMEQERVDIVHLNDEPVSNREGILACRLAGKPCVCHVHQYGSPNIFDRAVGRRVDFTIYNSGAVQRYWQRLIPFSREQVIYNGLDLNEYSGRADRAEIRRDLGLGGDDFVVLSLGRITEWKGQHILVQALGEARPRIASLACLIVGGAGTEADLAYQRELQDLSRSLGLSSTVRFLGHRSDVDRILAAADVLVHTSTSPEPFGLVIIEGMAASVPVVATNAGGVPEIVADGENGLLVPPRDSPALAQALVSIASDRNLARRLGQSGRASVEKRFTVERLAREVEGVYEAVLASSSARKDDGRIAKNM